MRFKLGKFLGRAFDVRFSRSAEREKFFLAMHIGFGRINLSPLAFRGRGMRRLDRKRKTSFGLRQIRLCNFAGSGLLFFFQHFLLGADQAGISEVKFEVNATQNSLLGL